MIAFLKSASVSIDHKVVSGRKLAQEFKFGVGVPAGRFSMTINFAGSAACICHTRESA
jgi:hypothetical protein